MTMALASLAFPFTAADEAPEASEPWDKTPASMDGPDAVLPGFPVSQTSFGVSATADASLIVRVNDEYVRLGFRLGASDDGVDEADVEADAGPVHNPPEAEARAPILPCRDARGCPDLVVDPERLRRGDVVTRTFSEASCAVVEGATEPGERRLMRFTFTTPNLGDGDLIVGNPADHPDLFVFADCHNHYHFVEYADYRLWEVDAYLKWQRIRTKYPEASAESIFEANPGLLDGFVAGHKQGFCVIDIVNYLPTESAKYRSCSTNQGISRGWADEYHHTLIGQWIDITAVAPGLYVLEAEVNAERLFEEGEYANNAAAMLVFLSDEQLPTPPVDPGIPQEVQELLRELIRAIPPELRDVLDDFIQLPE